MQLLYHDPQNCVSSYVINWATHKVSSPGDLVEASLFDITSTALASFFSTMLNICGSRDSLLGLLGQSPGAGYELGDEGVIVTMRLLSTMFVLTSR